MTRTLSTLRFISIRKGIGPLYIRTAYRLTWRSRLEITSSESISTKAARPGGFLLRLATCASMFRPTNLKRGGSYIPLPKRASASRGYLNVRNNDDRCFHWSVLAGLYPATNNAHETGRYERYMDQVDWKAINLPTSMDRKMFERFEHDNPELPPLNVHILNDKNNYVPMPFYSSIKPHFNEPTAINVAYFKVNEAQHFVLMKNPRKALAQLQKRGNASKHPCMRCYNLFASKPKLDSHTLLCNVGDIPQQINLPSCREHKPNYVDSCNACYQAKFITFDKFHCQLPIPVKLVVDTEAVNVKMNECQTCQKVLNTEEERRNHEHGTILMSRQRLISYGVYFHVMPKYVSVFPHLVGKYVTYTENDGPLPVEKHMIQTLVEAVEDIDHIIRTTNKPIRMPFDDEPDSLKKKAFDVALQNVTRYREVDPQAKHLFGLSNTCHICNKPLVRGQKLHLDHDHLNSEFRGVAHAKCNLKFTLKNRPVPILMHNFKNYDSKHILLGLRELKPEYWLNVVMENTEKMKFLAFTKRGQDKYSHVSGIFIDSLSHMAQSVETLTRNLANHTEGSYAEHIAKANINTLRFNFPAVSRAFPDNDHFRLLLRKGVMCYEFFDDPDKLNWHPTAFRHEDFADSLSTEGNISAEDYQHYLNVNRVFGFTTFKQYMDVYLKLDCLLLSDIIGAYAKMSQAKYGIDPWHFVSAPSLTWQACLKHTGVRLELPTDIDMYQFFSEGIRGGVSYIATKKAIADNQFTRGDCEPRGDDTFISYVDKNNLYGWAMSQPLPVGEFQWMLPEPNEVDFTGRVLQQLRNDHPEVGHIVEVDLEYPEEKHRLQNDFPLAPENYKAPGAEVTKLIPHFGSRQKYKVNGRLLLRYMHHGLRVTRIHRAIRFVQAPWLKSYIALNTEARREAKNAFEKDFFKLQNNAVYGQSLLNVARFQDFKLCTSTKQYDKVLKRPYLIHQTVIYHQCEHCAEAGDNEVCQCIIGAELYKTQITLDRPQYLGQTILDLAKLKMYEFYYDVLIPNVGEDNVRLLATDTDSFILQLQTSDALDFWIDLEKKTGAMDLSNFPKERLEDKLDMVKVAQKKKQPGYMKVESPDHLITRFFGIRSKCYAFESIDDAGRKNVDKTAKGVSRKCKANLTIDDYSDLVEGERDGVYITTDGLQSKKQKMFHKRQYGRLAMRMADDKRLWTGNDPGLGGLHDKYSTLAHNSRFIE